MDENAPRQSDCKIHKLAIFQKQLCQSARLIAYWCELKEGKRWFENLKLGGVKNTLGQSACRIPKTTIFQKRWG